MTYLQDIISFLETRLQQDSDLNGKVFVSWEKNPEPPSTDYAVQIYIGQGDPKKSEFLKIGPIVRETWQVNVDFFYNKSKTPKKSFAEAKGLSYWEGRLVFLLLHQQNNGMFLNSRWDFSGIDEKADAVTLKGVFVCEVENTYTQG